MARKKRYTKPTVQEISPEKVDNVIEQNIRAGEKQEQKAVDRFNRHSDKVADRLQRVEERLDKLEEWARWK